MSIPLITDEQRQQLLANGANPDPNRDPCPVVKLYTPDACSVWLLSEILPDWPDVAFGLCDFGQGNPVLGFVSLTELETVRGPFGFRVTRDPDFVADRPLSVYATEARYTGRI